MSRTNRPAVRPARVLPAVPPRDCALCGVRQLALFQSFPPDVLGRLSVLRRGVRMVPAGGQIVPPGQPAAEVFTVFRGWAFSYRLTHEGRRQILDFHLPGDLIGAEFLAAAPTGAGADALTAVSLCAFDAALLMQAAADMPPLAAALTWMVAREEAVLAERLTAVGRRSAADRLGHLLLEMWTRQRLREGEDGAECRFPLTNQHMADVLGLSPEHVSRSLAQWRHRQLAFVDSGRLRLPDAAQLAELCDWTPGYLHPRPIL